MYLNEIMYSWLTIFTGPGRWIQPTDQKHSRKKFTYTKDVQTFFLIIIITETIPYSYLHSIRIVSNIEMI
jgi:hypothetical protein